MRWHLGASELKQALVSALAEGRAIMSGFWVDAFSQALEAPGDDCHDSLPCVVASGPASLQAEDRHTLLGKSMRARQIHCKEIARLLFETALHRHSISVQTKRVHVSFTAPGFADRAPLIVLISARLRQSLQKGIRLEEEV